VQYQLVGDYAGGLSTFSSETFTVSSSNSAVATVGPDGTVLAVGAGSAGSIFISRAEAMWPRPSPVGIPDQRQLQFSAQYALNLGDTRQMQVRERIGDTIQDDSPAASGSLYYVSDPTIRHAFPPRVADARCGRQG